nr:MAG TPA: hypothetical protein [Caudoviricetes sp.]
MIVLNSCNFAMISAARNDGHRINLNCCHVSPFVAD